jgi:tRNA threonylcarbamoyladenosine biosynthesis protein TsaB
MALLLSLETSTHSFSCALHQDGKLVAFKESLDHQTTASLLTVMVDQLFKDAGFQKDQLSAVIVAAGPGSYTGLRIGVATAKGICFTLNIPLISINTLSLMVWQFVMKFSGEYDLNSSLLCPMLDARRMEVYCMLTDKAGRIIEPTQAKVIDELSFSALLDQKEIYFFGEGSDKCKKAIHHSSAKFVGEIKPLASALGAIGFQKFKNNEFENADLFEPFYLKDFVIKKPNLIS